MNGLIYSHKSEVAIFWDYENVPLPKKNGHLFLQALKIFFQIHAPNVSEFTLIKQPSPSKSGKKSGKSVHFA
ncbi:MAG: hypothetical protein RBG13Loki_3043 [Promethearchaeota archaeon CR_4]|nr:MAG: hypothetical protein RBG13Loki_3043 [Candidatus Lokiarchaeota archaeon CR_4]